MKKMNKYILWLLPVFGLFACEDEMEVYNSPENRLNFIYEPYTMADTVIPRTFVYDVETRVFDTVWLEVETIEIGYVKTRSATLNSTNMTLKSKKAIDLDNDRIIDGWACVWRYENSYGFEAGTFKAGSKSANSPWNTMNITFYIH